jgi:hypothetical protein
LRFVLSSSLISLAQNAASEQVLTLSRNCDHSAQAAASLKRSPTEQVAVEQFRESQLAVQSAATHVQAATAGTLADQVRRLLLALFACTLGRPSLTLSSPRYRKT